MFCNIHAVDGRGFIFDPSTVRVIDRCLKNLTSEVLANIGPKTYSKDRTFTVVKTFLF